MDENVRVCDCCGKTMKMGYVDCDKYYCSDRCLIWGNTPDGFHDMDSGVFYDMNKWSLDYLKNPDDCYYTEWEE